jgi:hypothetical protein
VPYLIYISVSCNGSDIAGSSLIDCLDGDIPNWFFTRHEEICPESRIMHF